MKYSFIHALLEEYKEIPLSSNLFDRNGLYGQIFNKANGSKSMPNDTPMVTNNHTEVGIPHSLANMPLEYKSKLQYYTDDSSGINSNLWKLKLSNSYFTLMKALKHDNHPDYNHGLGITVNRILEQHPLAKEDFHVFTGMAVKAFKPFLDNRDDIYHIPSFISTTLNPYVSKAFTDIFDNERHILRIKIRKGQQVGGYIQPHSSQISEEEFLIKPNQILKINRIPTIIKNEHKMDVHVHDAHILTDEEINQLPIDHRDIASYHKIKDLLK